MEPETSTYAFGPFVLDRSRRQLFREGMQVALTPKAFDILSVLVQRGGGVVEKEAIFRTVWPDTVVDEGSLTFQISALRKALGERSGGERFIATIPGRGYQLVVPVRKAEPRETETLLEEHSIARITVEATQPSGASRRLVMGTAAVLIVGIGAALVFVIRQGASSPPEMSISQIRSIAVLPFKPIVASQRDEALELGMADAVIARISTLRDVTVRPLTAVRRYGGLEDDALAAGRSLGVDAVLDGSIHNANGRVRVVARLLRVKDSRQLWQGQFDASGDEIFAVQDSISERMVDALSLNLTAEEQRRFTRPSTASLEAYRAYSIGRLHMWRHRGDEIDKAIGHFKRAIELDPYYALAHAGLADCYAILPISSDRPPGPNFKLAKAAIQKLIEIDPLSPDAYTIRGSVKFWSDWDWKGSEADHLRALELNPNHSLARLRYAHLLSNIGRHDEAAREAAEAVRLEPLSLITNALTGQFRLQAGDFDGAMRQLEHTLEIDPEFWIAHLNLGKTHELQRRYDKALAHYRFALERSNRNVEPLSMIGHLHGIRGQKAEAGRIAAELIGISRERYVPPTKIALVYAGMGENARAIEWLARACEDRDVGMTFLKINPRWDGLRNDPAFAAIEQCVNLPK